MASTRFAFVFVIALLLMSCGTRYHLAGELPGSGGGTSGSDHTGVGGAAAGVGGRSAGMGGHAVAGIGGVGPGVGGAAATNGGGLGGAPAESAPVPLGISAREALTRVARVLWETPPDETLVALADSGAVITDADVRRVALDMLADSRSRLGVGDFYRWWLNLDALITTAKDPTLLPEYSPIVGMTMAAETRTFALDVTFDGDGHYPALMLASYSFINEELAKLYGVPGVTGSALRKVDLDPTQRAGILTQGSFLTQTSSITGWTSPTHRGLFIFDRILCQSPPASPAGSAAQMLADPIGPETNRQRLTRSVSSPACRGCHTLFDPLGFAYEGFDSIGRVRLTDSGLTIDASGEAVFDSGDRSWTNAIEFAQILAASQTAHDCMGRQWLRYALGRNLTTERDEASVAAIGHLFAASGLDLRTVAAAAVSSATFLDPAGGSPCTPGLPQTCNDDPRLSSIHGACTSAGKCTCMDTYPINPATGRCM